MRSFRRWGEPKLPFSPSGPIGIFFPSEAPMARPKGGSKGSFS